MNKFLVGVRGSSGFYEGFGEVAQLTEWCV